MVFSELIALYLFVGGSAAGAFACIACVDVLEDGMTLRRVGSYRLAMRLVRGNALYLTRRRVSKLVYSVSFVLLLLGLGCLVADLGKPEAFYLLFLFPTQSLMTFGSFALTGMFICLSVALADSVLDMGSTFRAVALAAKVLGIACALFVMAYTGMLLRMVLAVQLWQSAWLAFLFAASALSCGCGIVLLCAFFCDGCVGIRRWLSAFSVVDIVCIVLEILFVFLFVCSVYNRFGEEPLTALMRGDAGVLFWGGFVALGLVVPLGIELMSFKMHTVNRMVLCVLALMVLAGGLSLRFALVNAGIHVAYSGLM